MYQLLVTLLLRQPRLFCCFSIPWASGRTRRGYPSPSAWTHLNPPVTFLPWGLVISPGSERGHGHRCPLFLNPARLLGFCRPSSYAKFYMENNKGMRHFQEPTRTMFSSISLGLSHSTNPTWGREFSSLGAENLASVQYMLVCAILNVPCAPSFEIEKPRLNFSFLINPQ